MPAASAQEIPECRSVYGVGPLVDTGCLACPLELAAAEVVHVVGAASGSGEEEAGIEPRRELRFRTRTRPSGGTVGQEWNER